MSQNHLIITDVPSGAPEDVHIHSNLWHAYIHYVKNDLKKPVLSFTNQEATNELRAQYKKDLLVPTIKNRLEQIQQERNKETKETEKVFI